MRRADSRTGKLTREAAVLVPLTELVEDVGLHVALELFGHHRHELD